MLLCTGHRSDVHGRAAPAPRPLFLLRAAARVFRRWWAGEGRYRPERRYMRGGKGA